MTEPRDLQLGDLVGTRVLDGVNRSVSTVSGDEQLVVLLRLNGVTYRLEEDENDGYRSALGSVSVVTDDVVAFEPVIVSCEMATQEELARSGGQHSVLVIREAMRGRRVLCRIGTLDLDGYYPSFVFEWTPVDGVPSVEPS